MLELIFMVNEQELDVCFNNGKRVSVIGIGDANTIAISHMQHVTGITSYRIVPTGTQFDEDYPNSEEQYKSCNRKLKNWIQKIFKI